jgi:hypothetical protein
MDAAVTRFVAAVCALLAACAIASEPRLATDGGDVDSGEAPDGQVDAAADASVDAPPDACIAADGTTICSDMMPSNVELCNGLPGVATASRPRSRAPRSASRTSIG